MGKRLTKEACFIGEIKHSHREREVRVKIKDLINFFCFVEEVSLVNFPAWEKVGQDINRPLKASDPVSAAFFSYWGIIRDVLKDAKNGGEGACLLAIADFLHTSQ